MITKYRPRVLEKLLQIVTPLEITSALDFGAGDGYFATHIEKISGIRKIVAVDVVKRKHSLLEPLLYDGQKLPFEDQSFDLVYAVDVVHHCLDPIKALDDMMRCTHRYLLLKDHNYTSYLGYWTLSALDEIGNRRFGIPSPQLYQKNWKWLEYIERSGFRRIDFTCPMNCHIGLLGLTNQLQFMALWERECCLPDLSS